MVERIAQGESKQEATRRGDGSTYPAYKTKEIAEIIGVATSTVRKYSIALEIEGHSFIRNPQKQRLFVDDNIVALRSMYDLTKSGTTVDNAAKIVAHDRKSVSGVPAQANTELVEKLLSHIEKQDKQTQELNSKVDNLTNMVETLIKERDEKDKVRLIEDNGKRNFFSRLFSSGR